MCVTRIPEEEKGRLTKENSFGDYLQTIGGQEA